MVDEIDNDPLPYTSVQRGTQRYVHVSSNRASIFCSYYTHDIGELTDIHIVLTIWKTWILHGAHTLSIAISLRVL